MKVAYICVSTGAQNEAFDQSFFLAGADKPAHGLARWLGCAPYIIIEEL